MDDVGVGVHEALLPRRNDFDAKRGIVAALHFEPRVFLEYLLVLTNIIRFVIGVRIMFSLRLGGERQAFELQADISAEHFFPNHRLQPHDGLSTRHAFD